MTIITANSLITNELFFYKALGVEAYSVILSTPPLNSLQVGQILNASAACIISSRPSPPYPGYLTAPSFTATQVFLTNVSPFVSYYYTWTGNQFGPNTGMDINPGNQPFCYGQHVHNWNYTVTPSDVDGNPRWVVFVAWCSSDEAGRWDYLYVEPTESELQVNLNV